MNFIPHTPETNLVNLQRMVEHLKTIPQSAFDIENYRTPNIWEDLEFTHKCNTIGCIVGHCTELDTPENIKKFANTYDSEAGKFLKWSKHFTGFGLETGWEYCFSGHWESIDNTVLGAIARLQHFIDNGLPENWKDQIEGNAPLSYRFELEKFKQNKISENHEKDL